MTPDRSNAVVSRLAMTMGMAAAMASAWPSTGRGQDQPPDPTKHDHQHQAAAKPTEAGDPFANQVRQLRDQVAKLEAALSQGQGAGQSQPMGQGQGMGMGARVGGKVPAGYRIAAQYADCLRCHRTIPSDPLPPSHLEKVAGMGMTEGGSKPGAMPAATNESPADQLQQLRDQVARLEAVLSQGQGAGQSQPLRQGRGMGMAGGMGRGGMGMMSGGMSRGGQGMGMMGGGKGMMEDMDVGMMGGGGKGMMEDMDMGMMGGGKRMMEDMDMGMMGGGGKGMMGGGGKGMMGGGGKGMMGGGGKGMMGGGGKGMMGGGGKGKGGGQGMGMGMMDGMDLGMMGMGAMGRARKMAGMAMDSALPGFPGISHLYHIGAEGFFLNHVEHITLSADQRKKLNRIKEKALLGGSSCERKVEEAEQELWELTASDAPDAAAIEAKVREIEKLRAGQRLAFIRAVGEAAKVLTDDQRKALAGTATDASPKPGTANP